MTKKRLLISREFLCHLVCEFSTRKLGGFDGGRMALLLCNDRMVIPQETLQNNVTETIVGVPGLTKQREC